MRIEAAMFLGLTVLLGSCGSEPKPAETPKQAELPRPKAKPDDESRRFPKENLVESRVVDKELLGHPFLPGGTLAHYKKGAQEYDMFIAKLPSANDAAILLLDYKKAMADPKLIPSFGGYFGKDQDRPAFVFSKGPWVAGIVGLREKDADTQARRLAANLN